MIKVITCDIIGIIAKLIAIEETASVKGNACNTNNHNKKLKA